ncbi:GNAT family N-acetyltransferase [Cohnella sp. REN36]|uniref:GNAT family N-acetyltransferase n=1 Tax=Cohnella sp. REN36 TaxID=2887347 RepID=UPI001D15C6DE|nr:GNAT family protein [Cohnella sp. REN36]MCC3376280.1 GNAT family N-acetyltransferase [Cohnella sp. REN36]
MNLSTTQPLLLSVPEQFETARLLIRAPQWEDGKLVNEAVLESLDELRPWLPWAKQAPTIEDSEVSVRKARIQYLERSDLRLHLIQKETGRLVGGSGLHRIDWAARRFEIGYWLRTSCTGQGYMAEAVEGIERFAIHDLQANRIEIRCDSRNTRSARVAERLGYLKEGVLRRERLDANGELFDMFVFAKVRGEDF